MQKKVLSCQGWLVSSWFPSSADILSSERFWVIWRNYSFLLTLPEWKVFLFLRRILKKIVLFPSSAYIVSSGKFCVIRRNYSFLLTLPEWKVFLFLRRILKMLFYVVLFECSSEFYGNSTASLWFPFLPCQSESTPISLLQTYRSSVFCFTAIFLRSC